MANSGMNVDPNLIAGTGMLENERGFNGMSAGGPMGGPLGHDDEIGEADTWLDKIKTLVRQNKLAVFSAVVILLIIFAAVFAPFVAPYDH